MDPYVIVRSVPGERFTQKIESGKHQLLADKQIPFDGLLPHRRGQFVYLYLLEGKGKACIATKNCQWKPPSIVSG